ncbi:hypothetical protein F0562_018190 [Nyssa sinensis]|uniref:Uncharacterized protein n=1 Tax=Nyssa sinensis TaxID=561372 RepID=A0A5J4Z8J8_9ASTE|nr:hypothetical protein F0562_018190 [Nyssa sinensis]
MDLDLALRVSCSAPLTDESSSNEKRGFERWEKSNRMCLMIIKKAIPEAFRGIIFETIKTTKEFLEEIENRFAKNEKSETSTLLENLISMRYKGNGNIREYIMEMSRLASKLRAHKLDLSKDLLVHLVLISLPTQFSQFKGCLSCRKPNDGERCIFVGDGKKVEVEAIGIFRSTFEKGNARFFEDVEFDGGDKDRDFVFEGEYVDIPTAGIDIDQAPIPDIVQEADPNQNNIQEPSVLKEQTLPPLEPTPLRRSTRERRSAVSDDYIVFLQEHEFDIDGIERPLKLFCDNKSAVLYSNNNKSSTKSKFIDIKFLVVKEIVQSGLISIEHIGSNSMIADPLTKGLPPKVFHEHTAHMGVVSLQDMLF